MQKTGKPRIYQGKRFQITKMCAAAMDKNGTKDALIVKQPKYSKKDNIMKKSLMADYSMEKNDTNDNKYDMDDINVKLFTRRIDAIEKL